MGRPRSAAWAREEAPVRPLFVCHESARFDGRVRWLVDEMRLRGLIPWVAQDGGFHLGDEQESEARHVIGSVAGGTVVYVADGLLWREFVRRVELPAAIRRKRLDPFIRILRPWTARYVLTGVLDGVTAESFGEESRQLLGYDLTRHTMHRLRDDDFSAASRALLRQQLVCLPGRPDEISFQFSTREALPDDPGDLLRIDGVALVGRDRGAWPRVYRGLLDVKRELGNRFGRARLAVHGSRHLTGAFALGFTFPRSSGYELAVRTRDSVWSTALGSSGLAPLSVVRPTEKVPVLAVCIQGTDKDPIPAAARHLADRPAARLELVLARGGDMTNADGRSFAEWVRREVAAAVVTTGAPEIFVYASVPQALGMLIGYEWNALPPTTLFEYDRTAYWPSLSI